MVQSQTALRAAVVAAFALFLSGCGNGDSTNPVANGGKGTANNDNQHAHKPGAHSGIIVPVGADSYHAEAVFEKNGILRLYTLGQDESRLMEVDAEPVQAFVKAEGDSESESIILKPEPQSGDTNGKTSQFVGQLPREKAGKKIDVTIPNFRVGKERFRLSFSNVQESSHDVVQPKSVAAADEKKLYLEPGGIYTLADIKANGNMTASEKFKGFRAVHDMNPKVGDKICPITETLANPKCTWIVNGTTYEFCCPPCVDEFVTRAKEDPSSIMTPAAYIKKQ